MLVVGVGVEIRDFSSGAGKKSRGRRQRPFRAVWQRLLTADSATLTVTAVKPDRLRVVYTGWDDAVRAYIRWAFAAPQPTISIGQDDVPISSVCERVAIFANPIPDEALMRCTLLLAVPQTEARRQHFEVRFWRDETFLIFSSRQLALNAEQPLSPRPERYFDGDPGADHQ